MFNVEVFVAVMVLSKDAVVLGIVVRLDHDHGVSFVVDDDVESFLEVAVACHDLDEVDVFDDDLDSRDAGDAEAVPFLDGVRDSAHRCGTHS